MVTELITEELNPPTIYYLMSGEKKQLKFKAITDAKILISTLYSKIIIKNILFYKALIFRRAEEIYSIFQS